MPYQSSWVDPDIAVQAQNPMGVTVTIYHMYSHGDVSNRVEANWFTLDKYFTEEEDSVHGENGAICIDELEHYDGFIESPPENVEHLDEDDLKLEFLRRCITQGRFDDWTWHHQVGYTQPMQEVSVNNLPTSVPVFAQNGSTANEESLALPQLRDAANYTGEAKVSLRCPHCHSQNLIRVVRSRQVEKIAGYLIGSETLISGGIAESESHICYECQECYRALGDDDDDRPTGEQDFVASIIELTVKLGEPIQGEAWSDDHKCSVRFDAREYFARATQANIESLISIDWHGDYATDDVARECAATDSELRRLFAYLDERNAKRGVGDDAIGFECRIDEASARTWLSQYRPDVLPQPAAS